MLASLL
jgi:SAM-dependent methyltransferase